MDKYGPSYLNGLNGFNGLSGFNGCGPTCASGLFRYIGQTVTIFTSSGGLSGSGFTGVLISADEFCIRLLTSVGAPPACPLGSACGGLDRDDFGFCGGNPFGSICVIPTTAVVCYSLCAI